MMMIRANCRSQFTAEDIEFIATILRPDGAQTFLVELLADESSRDVILDDESLYRAVLESPACLRISSRFYFYILTRRVLIEVGIDDRNVADYIAEMLAQYADAERMNVRAPGSERSLDDFFEMVAALEEVDDSCRFALRAEIGNRSLFFTGVFSERIEHRRCRRGAPGLNYYESLGRSSFHAASDHRLAYEFEVAPIYTALADRFGDARRALNEMKERLFSMDDSPGLPAVLLEM
jgi:hypothetical protein